MATEVNAKSEAKGEHPTGVAPAPWNVDSAGWVYSGSPDTGGGNIVCDPPDDEYEASVARWPANSRLISAAPDLLAAATALVEFADLNNTINLQGKLREAVVAARAAIAKAGGAA